MVLVGLGLRYLMRPQLHRLPCGYIPATYQKIRYVPILPCSHIWNFKQMQYAIFNITFNFRFWFRDISLCDTWHTRILYHLILTCHLKDLVDYIRPYPFIDTSVAANWPGLELAEDDDYQENNTYQSEISNIQPKHQFWS